MKLRLFLIYVLVGALCLGLWGCGSEPTAGEAFDAEKDGIVKLILYDGETISYELIGTKGRRADTEEFESAALTALIAEANCFAPTIRDGKTCNEIVHETFLDDSGAEVVPDADDLAILGLTAEAHDQSILSLMIVSCGGRRFPLVVLEENTVLYYFNPDSREMTKLCDLGLSAVAGMQIVNPDNLP